MIKCGASEQQTHFESQHSMTIKLIAGAGLFLVVHQLLVNLEIKFDFHMNRVSNFWTEPLVSNRRQIDLTKCLTRF